MTFLSRNRLPNIDRLRRDVEPFSLDSANKRQAHQVALKLVDNINLARVWIVPFEDDHTADFVMQLQLAVGRPINLPTGIDRAGALASQECESAIISLNTTLEHEGLDSPGQLSELNIALLGMQYAIKSDLRDREGNIPHALHPPIRSNLLEVRRIIPEALNYPEQ
jgi:hypothetical protein